MTFDLLDPDFRRNPYPALARLRASDPVYKSPFGWIVTRHADVVRLNRDPRLGRDTRKLRGGGLAGRSFRRSPIFIRMPSSGPWPA